MPDASQRPEEAPEGGKRTIVFVGNARDFHAMDWYRTVREICPDRDVLFATDLIESEGHRRLITEGDRIVDLVNVDRWLLARQSRTGNVWRNFVKALAAPLQVLALRRFARRMPSAVYHAHTMYYLWVCWLAGVPFIGSPQGDEILIRPQRSWIYRFFAKRALAAADALIVDSRALQRGIEALSGRSADVIQYGIDLEAILRGIDGPMKRTRIVSIRALYPLYRIEEILRSCDAWPDAPPIWFFYPYWEEGYREMIRATLRSEDQDLGRLPAKADVYAVLNRTALAVSIPRSDSSPRSVYEAIFCGCCVAVTYNPWIEAVPECMRARIHVVDLTDPNWLEVAVRHAAAVVAAPYVPSELAIDMFDQQRSMAAVVQRYY